MPPSLLNTPRPPHSLCSTALRHYFWDFFFSHDAFVTFSYHLQYVRGFFFRRVCWSPWQSSTWTAFEEKQHIPQKYPFRVVLSSLWAWRQLLYPPVRSALSCSAKNLQFEFNGVKKLKQIGNRTIVKSHQVDIFLIYPHAPLLGRMWKVHIFHFNPSRQRSCQLQDAGKPVMGKRGD